MVSTVTYIAICFLVVFESHGVVGAKVTCQKCERVAEPHDCEVVTECHDDEQCYSEMYATDEGHVFWDLGCQPNKVCQVLQHFGRRSEPVRNERQQGRTTLCQKCCNTGHCNTAGCGNYVSPNRTICYNCNMENQVETLAQCESVSSCPAHHQCYHAYGLSDNFNLRVEMKCIEESICQSIYSSNSQTVGHPQNSTSRQSAPSMVGRDIGQMIPHTSTEKRDVQNPDGSYQYMQYVTCQYCCQDSYCNNIACVAGTPTTPVTTSVTSKHQLTVKTTRTTTHSIKSSFSPTLNTTQITHNPTHPTKATVKTTHNTTQSTKPTHPSTVKTTHKTIQSTKTTHPSTVKTTHKATQSTKPTHPSTVKTTHKATQSTKPTHQSTVKTTHKTTPTTKPTQPSTVKTTHKTTQLTKTTHPPTVKTTHKTTQSTKTTHPSTVKTTHKATQSTKPTHPSTVKTTHKATQSTKPTHPSTVKTTHKATQSTKPTHPSTVKTTHKATQSTKPTHPSTVKTTHKATQSTKPTHQSTVKTTYKTTPTTKPTQPSTVKTTHTTQPPKTTILCKECYYINDEIGCDHTSNCTGLDDVCYMGRIDSTSLNDHHCFYSFGCIREDECITHRKEAQLNSTWYFGDEYETFECCKTNNCNNKRMSAPPKHCSPL